MHGADVSIAQVPPSSLNHFRQAIGYSPVPKDRRSMSPLRAARNYAAMFARLLRHIRPWGLLRIGIYRTLGSKSPRASEKSVALRLRGLPAEVHVRVAGSDFQLLKYILLHDEYGMVKDLARGGTIVDCGANVGYASLYFFLHLHPQRIVAVEPDPKNIALCRRNLAGLPAKVEVIEAGVWSHTTDLVVERGAFRDGLDWSVIVRPANPGETPDVRALDMPTLFRQCGVEAVDLLKIDIEGSERELFAPGSSPQLWLRRVRNLVIEVHDEQCEAAFRAAMTPFEFEEVTAPGIIACKNIRPKDATSSSGPAAPHAL
jgi:FkbM family methyltransferase